MFTKLWNDAVSVEPDSRHMDDGFATARQCFESHHAAVGPNTIRRDKYCRRACFLCTLEAVSMAVRHHAMGHFDFFRNSDELYRKDTSEALVSVCGSYFFFIL